MHLGNINTQQTYRGVKYSTKKGFGNERKYTEMQVKFSASMKIKFVFVHM